MFEASDEFLVVGLDHRFVGIRVVAGERDDPSIVFDCQFGIAADLVDQTETGVSVVDAREAFQQVVGGLFCVVEPAGVDQIDDGIGGVGQFIIPLVVVPGLPGGRECLTFEGLILVQAAALVFLATGAGQGSLRPTLGMSRFRSKGRSRLYQALLADARFHALLFDMDADLAAACRAAGCPCGGGLHSARFRRKPRGKPAGLGDAYDQRFSFCCAVRECRRRATPPSLRLQGLSGDDRDVDQRPAARGDGGAPAAAVGEAGHRPSNRGALAGLVGVALHRHPVLADGNGRLHAASASLTPAGVSPRAVYRRCRTTPARLALLPGADHRGSTLPASDGPRFLTEEADPQKMPVGVSPPVSLPSAGSPPRRHRHDAETKSPGSRTVGAVALLGGRSVAGGAAGEGRPRRGAGRPGGPRVAPSDDRRAGPLRRFDDRALVLPGPARAPGSGRLAPPQAPPGRWPLDGDERASAAGAAGPVCRPQELERPASPRQPRPSRL